MATRLTSVDELKDFLRIPASETGQDARLGTVIEEGSAECETFTGRKFLQAGYSNEPHPGGGDGMVLNNPPVDSGSTLQIKNWDGTTLSIFDPADYFIDYVTGVVRLNGMKFSGLPNGAQATYTGGYAQTGAGTAVKAAVPGDLSRSVRKLAAATYKHQIGVIDQAELDKVRDSVQIVWSGFVV